MKFIYERFIGRKSRRVYQSDGPKFEEIQVCPWCSAPAKESRTLELTFCSDGCGCIEGEKNEYMFRCSHCEELKEKESCDCEARSFANLFSGYAYQMFPDVWFVNI